MGAAAAGLRFADRIATFEPVFNEFVLRIAASHSGMCLSRPARHC